MTKVFFALAALVAAGAVEAQNFSPLQNPVTSKCIVTGAYNPDLEIWAIKTGPCTGVSTVKFRHLGNGKALKTDKGFCLGTAKPSNKAGTKLILDECLGGALGQKWTKVGNNQWRNGYAQCIEASGGNIVQKPCKTLAVDNVYSTQQWVFYKRPTPPPPPPPTEINCFDWNKRYTCPVNYSPLDRPQSMTCVGATDESCYSVCCKKTPPKTCPSQVACAPGYSVINQACGNRPDQPCNQNYCCQLDTITCRRWNKCPPGSRLIPDSANVDCALVNNPFVPRCTQAFCCEPFTPPPPPPPTNYYCSDYFTEGNTCKPDYKEISDANKVKCDLSIDGDCNSMCCVTSIITCKSYFEDMESTCEPGTDPIIDADKVKCDTSIDGDCQSMCCLSNIPDPASV